MKGTGSSTQPTNKKSIVAGGISGVLSQAITWPVEVLKTSKQLPKYKNSSIRDFALHMYKKNGIRGFYRGIAPQLISAAPRASIRFKTFETAKTQLLKHSKTTSGKLTTLQHIICGCIAGAVEGATVMTPAESIKVNSINNAMTPIQSIKHVYNSYGLRGFYNGVFETTLRQATTQGTSFAVYHNVKQYLDKSNSSWLQSSSGLISGILGGCGAVMVNNPIDAIKTYKQSTYQNSSFISIGKEIYNRKGVVGFYNGGLLRMMRVAPLHGITFFTYDLVQRMSQKRNN